MLEYTRMNSTFKPSSEILWATGLSSLLTKQHLGITAQKKLRMFVQTTHNRSLTIPFSVPAAKCFDFEIEDIVVTAPLSFILLTLQLSPCFAVKLFDHVKI